MSTAVDSQRPSVATSAGRFAGLDGLRAIAAIGIFVHHVGFWSSATFSGYWGRYIGRLDVGVPVFFALSGFLLFRPIAESVIDRSPLRPALVHLWRRALRIYPAFWVAIVLIVAFTSEGFRDTTGAVVTVLLVQIHWPTHAIGPMPQAWSLATEVGFYAMLPLLARVARPLLADRSREGRRNGLLLMIAAGYVISVGFRAAVYGIGNRWTSPAVLWLPATFDYFAVGMAIAILHVAAPAGSVGRERLDRIGGPAGLWWLGALVAFHAVSQWMGLALGVETAWWPREMARQFLYGAIGFALLFPLVFGSERRSLVRRFAASRVMEWLGQISYSIYLWHMVFIIHVWQPLNRVVGSVWDDTVRSGWFQSSLGWTGLDTALDHRFFPLLIVAGIPTLAVATVSYYAAERTGQRLQGAIKRPTLDPTPTESWLSTIVLRWRAASFRAQIAVIGSAGLVLRVIYVITKRNQTLDEGRVLPGDQFYYSLAADALAAGKGFVVPWHDLSIGLGQAPPGSAAPHAAAHPPLTAIVSTPASLLPGDSLTPQRLTMALVGTAVIVVVGLLAREFAGARVGMIAAAMAAIYPAFWINDGLVMAESLTALTVAGAIWATLRYRRAPAVKTAVEIGLWVGLASLARSESLLLIPILIVPLMWVSHSIIRVKLARVFIAGTVVAVVIAPWVIPNLVRFNDPVVMSTNDGQTLLGANSPQTYNGRDVGFWTLEYSESFDVSGLDQSEVSGVYRRAAFDYMGDHLSELPRVVVIRVGRLWSVYQPFQMADWNQGEGRELWASYLALVGFSVVVPLAAVGWRRSDPSVVWRWPFMALFIQVTLVGAAFYGIPRFRVPAEIGLIVLAAVGLSWAANIGTSRHRTVSSSPPS